jgi:ligand-binding sensor domain-containing protein
LTNVSVTTLVANASGHLFAGTFGGVFCSTNNGDRWTTINGGLANLRVLSLAADATGRLFAGTSGGGVFRSTTAGSLSFSAANLFAVSDD